MRDYLALTRKLEFIEKAGDVRAGGCVGAALYMLAQHNIIATLALIFGLPSLWLLVYGMLWYGRGLARELVNEMTFDEDRA